MLSLLPRNIRKPRQLLSNNSSPKRTKTIPSRRPDAHISHTGTCQQQCHNFSMMFPVHPAARLCLRPRTIIRPMPSDASGPEGVGRGEGDLSAAVRTSWHVPAITAHQDGAPFAATGDHQTAAGGRTDVFLTPLPPGTQRVTPPQPPPVATPSLPRPYPRPPPCPRSHPDRARPAPDWMPIGAQPAGQCSAAAAPGPWFLSAGWTRTRALTRARHGHGPERTRTRTGTDTGTDTARTQTRARTQTGAAFVPHPSGPAPAVASLSLPPSSYPRDERPVLPHRRRPNESSHQRNTIVSRGRPDEMAAKSPTRSHICRWRFSNAIHTNV